MILSIFIKSQIAFLQNPSMSIACVSIWVSVFSKISNSFLYYEFEESEDDYPITDVQSFGEYDHPPGLNKLPLDTVQKLQRWKNKFLN